MKRARIIHNPMSGSEEHSKDELMELISAQGYDCEYFNVKDDSWLELDHHTDFLIISGGDGTVRYVIKNLLNRRLWEKKYPLALLPKGTANNLAQTLGIAYSEQPQIDSWKKNNLQRFSIGLVYGMEEVNFFLEAFGYGVFPELIHQMEDVDSKLTDTREKSLDTALKTLEEIVENYEADYFTIEADDVIYSGKYILVEVMNACSIGPNLNLSPNADPADKYFELVLVSENERQKLKDYVTAKRKGEDLPPDFKLIRCRNLFINSECKKQHIDDELIKSNLSKTIQIQLQDGILEFLV